MSNNLQRKKLDSFYNMLHVENPPPSEDKETQTDISGEFAWIDPARILFFDPKKYGIIDPYKPYTEEKLNALCESVRLNGVQQAITIRPIEHPDYDYECLSGHHRIKATIQTELPSIPSFIRHGLSDVDACNIYNDTNLERRDDLTIMERARAYSLRIQLNGNARDIERSENISQAKVYQTAALVKLIDPFKDAVENNKMAEYAGFLLSSLTVEEQKIVHDVAIANPSAKIDVKTAQAIAKLHSGNKLSEDTVMQLLTEKEKVGEPCYKGVKLPIKRLSNYFQPTDTPDIVTKTIFAALDLYREHQHKIEVDSCIEP